MCLIVGRAVRKPPGNAGIPGGVFEDSGRRNATGAGPGETGASGRVQGL